MRFTAVVGSRGEVSREGYRQMHMRIAKVLVESGGFDVEEASVFSDKDWTEDIARFSGTNHLSVWLDDIRNKFRDAAAQVSFQWKNPDFLSKNPDFLSRILISY